MASGGRHAPPAHKCPPLRKVASERSNYDEKSWPSQKKHGTRKMSKGKAKETFLLNDNDMLDLEYERARVFGTPYEAKKYTIHQCEYRAWQIYGGPTGLESARDAKGTNPKNKVKGSGREDIPQAAVAAWPPVRGGAPPGAALNSVQAAKGQAPQSSTQSQSSSSKPRLPPKNGGNSTTGPATFSQKKPTRSTLRKKPTEEDIFLSSDEEQPDLPPPSAPSTTSSSQQSKKRSIYEIVQISDSEEERTPIIKRSEGSQHGSPKKRVKRPDELIDLTQ